MTQRLLGKGLKHQDLDDAADSSAGSRCGPETLEQSRGILRRPFVAGARVAGKQEAGKCDMLELAQIAQIVIERSVHRRRPRGRLIEPSLGDTDACLHRGYR